jgi:hypothetical protein
LLPPDAIRARESGTGALPAAAAMEPEPEHAGEMVAAEGTLARSCHSRYAPCRYSASHTGAVRPTQTVNPTVAGASLLLCVVPARSTQRETAVRCTERTVYVLRLCDSDPFMQGCVAISVESRRYTHTFPCADTLYMCLSSTGGGVCRLDQYKLRLHTFLSVRHTL